MASVKTTLLFIQEVYYGRNASKILRAHQIVR